MKKRVHKNQIVITTLAVLIAVAGYVTYDKKGADIKDAETVANMNQGAVSDQADKDYETGEELDITSSKEDLATASTEDVENPGETVLTSVTSGDSDYAAKVKLNREQVRSKNKETLQAIIDNDSLDESKKKDAVNEMITLTDIAEKESNAEMMLDLMYRVPSDDSISKCVVDKKMVENNLALDGEEILGIEQDPKKEVKEELAS